MDASFSEGERRSGGRFARRRRRASPLDKLSASEVLASMRSTAFPAETRKSRRPQPQRALLWINAPARRNDSNEAALLALRFGDFQQQGGDDGLSRYHGLSRCDHRRRGPLGARRLA